MLPDSFKAISNASSEPLTVWLEPWCDEFDLLPKATLSVEVDVPDGLAAALPEFEITNATLVIWAAGPGTLALAIDGVLQDTGSSMIELDPVMFHLPVKDFVQVVFGDQPQTRPAGAPAPIRRSFWQRLFSR